MTPPPYCTREAVKRALDSGETARNNTRIDAAAQAGSRSVDSLCGGRRFYPELKSLKFDWPNQSYAPSWTLWFTSDLVISVVSVTSGGVALDSSSYLLRRADGRQEPPYTRLEIDRSTSAAFQTGTTPQQSIVVVAWCGERDDQLAAGALAEALDSSETLVDVTDSAAVGVGALIKVDSERMLVVGKQQLDTTVNLGADLAALTNADAVSVASGAAFAVEETITIGTEAMLIVDIVGNTLRVLRGFDGSVLAAHTTGADIYAPRTLVVERAAVGSTAASHDSGTAVSRWVPLPEHTNLAKAEALVTLVGEAAAYATKPGTQGGEPAGGSIQELRARVVAMYGRYGRVGAI
jgi:hypothetical protein